jgi:hypothetical protein
MGALVGRRAVSEILGAILVAVITVAISVVYASAGAHTAESQALSMVDVIRAAERRQRQLLSLTYWYLEGSNLHLFIYNYGNENSTIKALFVGDYNVTGVVGVTVTPKELKEVSFTCPRSGLLDVVLLTREGGIFIWKISV